MAFLNKEGLTHLWAQITDLFVKKSTYNNDKTNLQDGIKTLEGYFDSEGNAKKAIEANSAINATSATQLAKDITLTLGGVATGSATFNGSKNINLSVDSVSSATSATNDSKGNVIAETYVNNTDFKNAKDELDRLANSLGVPSGIATLDNEGKVPASQLPSYVDDVLEYPTKNNFPAEGESGKIYVALDSSLAYRWGGSAYVEISPSLALGETASTAYPGNKGKELANSVATINSNLSDVSTNVSTLQNLHATTNDKATLALYKMKITNGHPTDLSEVTSDDITGMVAAITTNDIDSICANIIRDESEVKV